MGISLTIEADSFKEDIQCQFEGCEQRGEFKCYWPGEMCLPENGCSTHFCEFHEASMSPVAIKNEEYRVCSSCAIEVKVISAKVKCRKDTLLILILSLVALVVIAIIFALALT